MLILAALIAAGPCVTEASMAATVRDVDPYVQIAPYHGSNAHAFVAAFVRQAPGGPALDPLKVGAVVTYTFLDPSVPVVVRFFGLDGCAFYGANGSAEALATTIHNMGVGA